MDRAFSSGSSASPPAAPASPSIGYPTSGNSGTGTPATKPGPYWYHMITEELRGLIVAAGLTPAQGDVTQLLQAMRAAGLFTTPAQFDITTKAATTAFVQRALGNFQNNRIISTAVTLTAADAGSSISVNAGGSLVLPLGSTVPLGASFTIFSTISACSVSRQGSDTLSVNGTVTSISMGSLDSVTLVWNGGQWLGINGTMLLKGSSQFNVSLAANGYQKLPSGLIVQWGATGASSAGGSVTVAFPITFPSGVFSIAVAPISSGGFASIVESYAAGSFQYGGWTNTSTRVAGLVSQYIAIGI